MDVKGLIVVSAETGDFIGEVKNLSFGGMLLDSAAKFAPAGDYKLRLIYEDEFLDIDYLDFDAKCVWADPTLATKGTWNGFDFEIESDFQLIFIDQVMERFKIKH